MLISSTDVIDILGNAAASSVVVAAQTALAARVDHEHFAIIPYSKS